MGFTPNPEKQNFIRLRLAKEPHPGGRTTDKAKKYYSGLYHRMDKGVKSREVAKWRAAQGAGDNAATTDATQSTEESVDVDKASGVSADVKNDADDRVDQSSKAKSASSSADPSRRQTRSSSQSAQAAAAKAAAEQSNHNTQDDNADKNEDSIQQENVESTQEAPAHLSRKPSSTGKRGPAEQSQDVQGGVQTGISDQSAILLDFADGPIDTETAENEHTEDDDNTVDKPGVGGESVAAREDANLDTPAQNGQPANADTLEQSPPQITSEDGAVDADVNHAESPKDTGSAESVHIDDKTETFDQTGPIDADDQGVVGSPGAPIAQDTSPPSPTGAVAGTVPAGGAEVGLQTDDPGDEDLNSLFVSNENDVPEAAPQTSGDIEEKQANQQFDDDTAKAEVEEVASCPPASQPAQQSPQEMTPPPSSPLQEDDENSDQSTQYSTEVQSEMDVNEVQQQDSDADERDNEQQDPSAGFVGEGMLDPRDEQELKNVEHDGGDREWGATDEYLHPEANDAFLPDDLLPESPREPSQSPPEEAEGERENEKKRKLPDDLETLPSKLCEAYVSSVDAHDAGQNGNDVGTPEGPKQKRPRLRKPGKPPLPRDGEQTQSPSTRPAPTQPAENGDEGQTSAAPKSFLSNILHDAATKPQYQWRPGQ